MIFWDGISSDDMRVVVEHYPDRHFPRRKISIESIPGRNGDILTAQDAYENIVQSYDMFINARFVKLPRVIHNAAEWLLRPGYRRLEDSYDPDHFRLAYFAGGTDVENTWNMYGRFSADFSCKPQLFLKSGEFPITVTNGKKLANPTEQTARPLILVHGSGAGTITMNGKTVSLTNCNDVYLDCEEMDAYKGSTNMNSTMTGEFPYFPSGVTTVNYSGGISSLEITPRWWTL